MYIEIDLKLICTNEVRQELEFCILEELSRFTNIPPDEIEIKIEDYNTLGE